MSRYLHQTGKKGFFKKKEGCRIKKNAHVTISAASPWQPWLGIRLTGVGSLCNPFVRWRKALPQRSPHVKWTRARVRYLKRELRARVSIAKLFCLWNIKNFISLQIPALSDRGCQCKIQSFRRCRLCLPVRCDDTWNERYGKNKTCNISEYKTARKMLVFKKIIAFYVQEGRFRGVLTPQPSHSVER